jgi:4-hydroxybenzoate polyprenyltransferase
MNTIKPKFTLTTQLPEGERKPPSSLAATLMRNRAVLMGAQVAAYLAQVGMVLVAICAAIIFLWMKAPIYLIVAVSSAICALLLRHLVALLQRRRKVY